VDVIARNRNQHDGYSLRQILSESRPVQRVKEELVKIRRASVDNRERRQTRLRIVRCELKSRDVPIESVELVSHHVPLRTISKTGGGHIFQFFWIESSAWRCIGQRLHSTAAIR